MDNVTTSEALSRLEHVAREIEAFATSARSALADPTLPRSEKQYWTGKLAAYEIAAQRIRLAMAAGFEAMHGA
jgi:hypothetical protein